MQNNAILMGGPPSTGSTLVSVLLDSHKDIFCGPETTFLSHPGLWSNYPHYRNYLANIWFDPNHGTYEGITPWVKTSKTCLEYFSVSHEKVIQRAFNCNNLIEFYNQLLWTNNAPGFSKARWVEKTPTNIYSINSCLEASQENLALITMRNPYAVVDSLLRRNMSLVEAVSIWVLEAAISKNILEKYQNTQRVLLIKYEDFLASPKKNLEQICKFIGVENQSQEMLEHKYSSRKEHDVSLLVGAAGKWRNNPVGEITTNNLNKWQETLPRNAIDAIERAMVSDELSSHITHSDIRNATGHDLMEYFGYEKYSETLTSPEAPLGNFNSDYTRFIESKVNIPHYPEAGAEVENENGAASQKTPKTTIPKGSSSSRVACLIATYKRKFLTELAIKSIKHQTEETDIYIVGSDNIDRQVAEENDCYYLETSNEYLGAKWQAGLDYIKSVNMDKKTYEGVAILGSGDMLTPNYLEVCLKYIQAGFSLVGKNIWYILETDFSTKVDDTKLYRANYNLPPMWEPLGAGRVYSQKFLEQVNWKLFYSKTKKQLHTQGFLKVLGKQGKCAILNTPVKGNSVVFNTGANYPLYFCMDNQEAMTLLKNISFREEDIQVVSIKDKNTPQLNSLAKILKVSEHSDKLTIQQQEDPHRWISNNFKQELCAALQA